MHSWASKQAYYNNLYSAEPEGYDEENKDAYVYVGQLQHMRDHFSAVLRHLYGREYLNTGDLEFSLEEVAYGLSMQIPDGHPTVERQRINFCMCNMIKNEKYISKNIQQIKRAV